MADNDKEPEDSENVPATSDKKGAPEFTNSFHAQHADSIKEREGKINEERRKIVAGLKSAAVSKLPFPTDDDILKDRYTIDVDKPLPDLSYGRAKAYAAADSQRPNLKIYAVVCHKKNPYRMKPLKEMENFKSPHMMQLIAHGAARISTLEEYRYVLIFELPQGKRLSDLLRNGKRLNEDAILHQVITPLASVIESLKNLGICHGHINPDTIYISDRTVVTECISQPCGYSQEYVYEPPERITATSYGKGPGDEKTDVYALAILTIECFYGLEKIRQIDEEMFCKYVMDIGPYNLFTTGRHLNDNFVDLIRGSFNFHASERWGVAQIRSWLSGKRFNLIQLTSSREATRPVLFADTEYFSRAALAYMYFKNWSNAKDVQRNITVSRWLEQVLHKKDSAADVVRAISSSGGEYPKDSSSNHDLLSRVILVLDPQGPIRLQNMSFHLDSLDFIYADVYLNDDKHAFATFQQALYFDLPVFQSELSPENYQKLANVLWQIESLRQYMPSTGIGFGTERVLYDLNPHLTCMSKLLEKFHISNNKELLLTLDHLAKGMTVEDSLMDTHISAFAASRLNMTKPATFGDLTQYPEMAKSRELGAIRILAAAQKREKIDELFGLAHWCALRVLNDLPAIHGNEVRTIVCKKIRHAAEDGSIGKILETLTNSAALKKDHKGFLKACKVFRINYMQVKMLRNSEQLKRKASAIGTAIAAIISFIILMFMSYTSLKDVSFGNLI